MRLNRVMAVAALVGFLFAGGLGTVAPLTLCGDDARDIHLATLADDCCPTSTPLEPSWQASAGPNCCLELAPAVDAPAKAPQADAPAILLPLPGFVQTALACPTHLPLPKPLDDPPGGHAGAIVMRC